MVALVGRSFGGERVLPVTAAALGDRL